MKSVKKPIKFILSFLVYILFLSFLGCQKNVLTFNPFEKQSRFARGN
ncbi:hypothetical protein SAMN04488028_101576 [Reichenbachiella agariperforans]|uniref:Lipoprotein n=1 Tax=Reichenbachiella agariperforans TaxID=156994 RepID=A0A1M6KH58_REIAG|nr:hypothetical protein SAMN04488028_101576 [Reichenbachiella agariperforans]